MRRQKPPATLPPAAVKLVQCVTGAQPGDALFDGYAQYVCNHLYEVGGLGSNRNKYFERSTIDRRIKGLAEKFSLRGQGDRAHALEEYLKRIRELAPALLNVDTTTAAPSSTRDAENVLSCILLVLLELSESPTSVALHRPPTDGYSIPRSLQQHKQPKVDEATKNRALWQSILKEEPLEGEHWATVRDVELDSDDSDYDEMSLKNVGEKTEGHQQAEGEQGSSQHRSGPRTATTLGHFNQHHSLRRQEEEAGILRDLENLQYWQASNISKKRHERVQAQHQLSSNIQEPGSVNVGLEQFQNDAFAANTLPIDELDLIQETLLMLLGEYSICFMRDQNQTIRPQKGIIMSHVSPDTLNNILLEMSTHGTHLCKIEHIAQGVCSQPIHAIGKIVQTFASSTLSIVREKRNLFSRLQHRYRYGNPERPRHSQLLVSLLELYDDVSRHFSIVADLLHFVERVLVQEFSEEASCAMASNLLSALHNIACQAELSGDQETFGMFHGLLRDSMTPLLRSIQHWLNGEQMSDEKDFFIKENPSVDLFSNDFWESGYSFQADISEGIDSSLVTKLLIPSFFKADDLDMILYIGKAVRILECANGLEALNDQSMNTTFAETLTTRIFGDQNSQRNSPREVTLTPKSGMAGIIAAQFPLWTRPKTAPPSNASGLHHPSSSVLNSMWNSTDLALSSTALTTNFQWLLDRELTEAIKGQYARINRGIHDTMTGKCRLWWHIDGMCSFYLMMNGEIMNDFSLALFKKLMLTQHGASSSYARRQLDLDSYSLGAMFSNLAEQHRWPMRAFATVRHHSSAEIQKSSKSLHPTLGQIEDVEFDYMLPWPLSGFIYPTMANKRMLQRISVFLLQIKVAKHAIEQASLLYTRPKPSPTARMFWKLRLHLLSVINDIWTYCMTTVLDAQRKEFEHELKKRQGSLDLDELVRFTTAFVRTGHERLFLGSKALPLLRSFKGLLELTLDFTKWMTKFLAVQDQRAMMDEDEGIATAGTATAAGRSSLITRKNHRLSRSNVRGHAAGEGGMSRHRVSFGASQIHRHTAGMADSDEDDEAEEDEEEDEEDNDGNSNEFDHGDEERGMDEDSFRHLAAEKRSHDDESHSLERAHEDIEMAEVPGRVPRSKPKKQKTSLTSARGMQEEEGPSHSHPQQQRQEQQQQKQQRRQQQRRSKLVGENEDQYFMSKLQELEHELIRRKRFLADNLKIIVQSNVAKKSSRLGDTAHRGSNGRSGYDDENASPQESGSSYLQGLIYALS